MSKEKPLVKIGVISDVQAYDVREDWGMSNLIKALKILAPLKPEVIINAGDLADSAEFPDVYNIYNQLFAEYFPDKLPQQVICAGNHDVWGSRGQSLSAMLDEFCRRLAIPRTAVYRKEINGFDFIAVSEEHVEDYTAETIAQLRQLLDESALHKPGKPVFVVTHYPPADTMSGSCSRHGRKSLRNLFNEYPQVVSLSGHTHYPLEDERAIWQQEFTAVTTATLSYGCIAENLFNVCNGILPFAREAVQVMYMEVFADKVVIRRYNVEDAREIKPHARWQFHWPYNPAQPELGLQRIKNRRAPEFPETAQLLLRYDYGFVYAVFDAARHDDMVKYYHIRTSVKQPDGSWKEQQSVDFAASFYRLQNNCSTREFLKLPDGALVSGEWNRIEIFPVETFGLTGRPLTVERLIPFTWRYRQIDPMAAPQE